MEHAEEIDRTLRELRREDEGASSRGMTSTPLDSSTPEETA